MSVDAKKNRSLVLYFVILAAAAGAIVAMVLFVSIVPKGLDASEDPESVPVASEQSFDAHDVNVQVIGGGNKQLYSKIDGIVTRIGFEAGDTVKSGQSPFAVNGKDITFVHTEVPFFNDDGYRIWIPTDEILVWDVYIALGDALNYGQAIASIPNSIASARILNMPVNLIPGVRMLDLGDVGVYVEDDGSIIGAERLVYLMQSTVYKQALANAAYGESGNSSISGQDITFQASFRLEDAVGVTVVSPRSIVTTDAGVSCVTYQGAAIKVNIIGSELGRTFVTFDGSAKPDIVDYQPDAAVACQ